MPTDILWETTDPEGRKVILRKETAEYRERIGKHADASHMTAGEAKVTVENPHIIQLSSSDESRKSYYRYEEEDGKPPYKRVTVISESDDRAIAISWGRQGHLPAHEKPIRVYMRHSL